MSTLSKLFCWRNAFLNISQVSSTMRCVSGSTSGPTSFTTCCSFPSCWRRSMILLPQLHPLAAGLLLPPVGDLVDILAVAVEPRDRGIVPRVGELPVERPETAHEPFRVLRDRLREIAARRRHRSDDADRALGAAERLEHARALVELGEPRRQVRGEALVGGHFLHAARELAKRLGPARGRVGHDRHVVPLVAVVLGDRDSRVDRSLARRHRHVRRIGDHDRALHEGPFRSRIDELGELMSTSVISFPRSPQPI